MDATEVGNMSLNRQLSTDGHVHTFTVTSSAHGWDIIEEEDSCVISRVHREDWHRVEVDSMLFEIRARCHEHADYVDTKAAVAP
jgi:hypothetical protein